jgi:DNA invertase Pin-like site-specific DNA recombinase
MTKRAVIYTRISRDKGEDDDGDTRSTDRQEEACRSMVDALGWTVVGVENDEGISGWSGKDRPGFNNVVAYVESRAVDVVVVWKLDRLSRRVKQVAEFGELLEEHGAALVSVVDGVNTATSGGDMVLHMLALLAQMESKNISVRVGLARSKEAAMGMPHFGSVKPPYGFLANRVTHHPVQAHTLREAARRLLEENRPVARTVRELDPEADVKAVLRALRNPTIAGYRQHNGVLRKAAEPKRDEHGEVIPGGGWDPIIEEDLWNRLQERFGGHAFETEDGGLIWMTDPVPRGASRGLHVLTGLVECTLCGSQMLRNNRRYVCQGPVAHSSMPADFLEDLVRDEALADRRLREIVRAASAEQPDFRSERERVEAMLYELRTMRINREIEKDEYRQRLVTLNTELAAINLAEVRAATVPLTVPVDGDLSDWWDGADRGERHRLMQATVKRVYVRSAAEGREAAKAVTEGPWRAVENKWEVTNRHRVQVVMVDVPHPPFPSSVQELFADAHEWESLTEAELEALRNDRPFRESLHPDDPWHLEPEPKPKKRSTVRR